ncbi:MAG: methionyl-tRNA formyltransferase [Opitutaceae bacterium]|nr:methionyl-tRNA formyltransferase [Opitutaceae bacterium]
MGSDAIALPALDWLAGAGRAVARVTAVYTPPDRAAGRGQQVRANAVKLWALARGLPVLQPEKIGPAEQAELAARRPDLCLVMAYGHLLPQEFLDTPRLGTLNLHTSLLPRYRGASPIQTAVAAGDRETGVSLMRLVRRMDAGPVAGAERVPIGPLDTAAEVESRLGQACVPLLARCLPRIAAGTQEFVEQDPAAVSFCRLLRKEDGGLDFHQPAAVLAARVNGLMPWPGCTVPILGQVVKLGLADAIPGQGAPGLVRGADPEGLQVGTGGGILRLRRLQRPGGRMLPAAEFLRGFPVPAGTPLPSRPMPPLVASQPFARRPPGTPPPAGAGPG